MEKRVKVDKVEQLFTWARENGAKLDNIEIRYGDGGMNVSRTAFARNSVDEDGLIGFIPSSILLSESVAKSSTIGTAVLNAFAQSSEVDPDKNPHGLELVCLAAFMSVERHNKESFWAPYLDALPLEYNLPICWPQDSLETLLSGTSLLLMTKQRLRWINSSLSLLNEYLIENKIVLDESSDEKYSLIKYDDFVWAYSSISSRAFPKAKKGMAFSNQEDQQEDWIRITEICLYPILDMVFLSPNSS
jgi:hypothetical protein